MSILWIALGGTVRSGLESVDVPKTEGVAMNNSSVKNDVSNDDTAMGSHHDQS